MSQARCTSFHVSGMSTLLSLLGPCRLSNKHLAELVSSDGQCSDVWPFNTLMLTGWWRLSPWCAARVLPCFVSLSPACRQFRPEFFRLLALNAKQHARPREGRMTSYWMNDVLCIISTRWWWRGIYGMKTKGRIWWMGSDLALQAVHFAVS